MIVATKCQSMRIGITRLQRASHAVTRNGMRSVAESVDHQSERIEIGITLQNTARAARRRTPRNGTKSVARDAERLSEPGTIGTSLQSTARAAKRRTPHSGIRSAARTAAHP